MPKVNRNGQAAVLTDDQLAELFETLDQPHRLLFQICYHTAARVGEAVQLQRSDIINGRILYRAKNTKTKKTRDVIISPPLAQLLLDANLPQQGCIFPGRNANEHMTTQAADLALRKACDYIGLKGVSTHSFRRSLLTKLHRAGYSLRTLQQITQHQDIGNLARYLDVEKEEADQALLSVWG
ncbi:tyrosine-type recombinase/integrase [Leptolyngbya ohadii]|uniref:tyrosine-type recombinase/integrase n=1 Tax=Leptolyngbya ohadii TaxID=1962290 RepID=UPI000B59E040|nr:site-specific integrase [Leptolyngbya ohadii]